MLKFVHIFSPHPLSVHTLMFLLYLCLQKEICEDGQDDVAGNKTTEEGTRI